MKTLKREDVLAYLTVLNYGPALAKFHPAEQTAARKHILGCLHRVREQLDDDLGSKLDHREKLNGQDDPHLELVTKELAMLLAEKIENQE